MEILKVGSEDVEIRRRPRQRNMNLSVRPDGRIRVSCNLRRSRREIQLFVHACRDFISKRRLKLAELDTVYPQVNFLSGDLIFFFGETVPLEVVWSWGDKVVAKRRERAIEIVAPLCSTRAERQSALAKLYKSEARKWLAARLEYFAGLMGVKPTSLTIRGQRTLWGSCTGVGDISLNWKLLTCPPDVIDYVVIHELAHIPYRDHSNSFWSFVGRFDSKYKEHRKFLKTHELFVSRLFS